MKLDDAISAIKTFFLEILGFLLPGIIFWFSLIIFLKPNNQQTVKEILSFYSSDYIFAIIAYVTGYVLYGVCEWISNIKWLNNILGSGDWKRDVVNLADYQLALAIQNSKIDDESSKIKNDDVKIVRNIAMSSIKEAENVKIYTFMFRADLSQKTAIALILVAITGLLSVGVTKLCGSNYSWFKDETYVILSYLFLFIPSYFLLKTYSRFYEIAMKLPFSIFISRQYFTESENPSNATA